MAERRTENHGTSVKQSHSRRLEDKVLLIVKNLSDGKDVNFDCRLKGDLGFDSLMMMELMISLENEFSVPLSEAIGSAKTIKDLVTLIECGGSKDGLSYNINVYPLPKTDKHIAILKRFMKFSRMLWNFNVSGLENIANDKQYIFCSNHISTFDGLWIWSAIGYDIVNLNKTCCLVKHEFIDKKTTNFGMTLLGGIPVDRRGNALPAIKRCIDCVKDENYSLIIHPEGTVTRDGKLQDFKHGAAEIAISTNTDIIPVKIMGAVAKVKNGLAMPKVIDWKRLRRYSIHLYFGKPISPEYKNTQELTDEIRTAIEGLGLE